MLLLCLKNTILNNYICNIYIYGKKLFKKSKAHINPLTAKVLLFVIILPQCGGIYALLLVCIFLPPTLIKILFQLSHRKLKCSHSECEQRDRNETIIFFDTSYRLRSFTVMRQHAPHAHHK